MADKGLLRIQSMGMPMKSQSIDTDQKAEEVLISLLRKASSTEKISLVCSLSQTVVQLSRRAIARRNKNLDEKELNVLFVAHNYGKDLAERLRKYLGKREDEKS